MILYGNSYRTPYGIYGKMHQDLARVSFASQFAHSQDMAVEACETFRMGSHMGGQCFGNALSGISAGPIAFILFMALSLADSGFL